MKINFNTALVLIGAMAFTAVLVEKWIDRPVERASSFAGYQDKVYQIGDTLFVVNGSDTIRLDVSRLEVADED